MEGCVCVSAVLPCLTTCRLPIASCSVTARVDRSAHAVKAGPGEEGQCGSWAVGQLGNSSERPGDEVVPRRLIASHRSQKWEEWGEDFQ